MKFYPTPRILYVEFKLIDLNIGQDSGIYRIKDDESLLGKIGSEDFRAYYNEKNDTLSIHSLLYRHKEITNVSIWSEFYDNNVLEIELNVDLNYVC